MPILKPKPTGNARRRITYLVSEEDKSTPEKSLTSGRMRKSGRNHAGQLVVAHKGSGAKRKYRLIDFNLGTKLGVKATVSSIQYDPNRTANIALLGFETGEKAYVIATSGMKKVSQSFVMRKRPSGPATA